MGVGGVRTLPARALPEASAAGAGDAKDPPSLCQPALMEAFKKSDFASAIRALALDARPCTRRPSPVNTPRLDTRPPRPRRVQVAA